MNETFTVKPNYACLISRGVTTTAALCIFALNFLICCLIIDTFNLFHYHLITRCLKRLGTHLCAVKLSPVTCIKL